ncbi:interferon-induced protein with tetratricopeptide repeats 2 [Sciurus carolinensis]|uniref:interferon-induced protein with tetratricopeptide repeats 2 n=1 Tax=Sciurus carolinensis TaxID=30640 RepID=UPI001FB464A7|nr:interferon-induced protein with tetratricopeptide repeats 2 [Sciurus carolinensis]
MENCSETVSEITKKSLEKSLQQLKCHFTWNLMEGEKSLDEFEDKVLNKYEFQNDEFKATTYNLSAYIKHHRGQYEAALAFLRKAEESIQEKYPDQAEIRSLVTWGNYAWVYYYMDQLEIAQSYVNKVKEVCAKFSSPYRIESPEFECDEGWARLKCTKNQNERAKMCFEKALEKNPKNPESTFGWAIANYRLDDKPPSRNSMEPLKKATELNSHNQYIRVLLALKLQKMNEEDKGESLVKEALKEAPDATDVLRAAAKFYQKNPDLSIKLLKRALKHMPDNAYLHYSIGCCYRSKILELLNGRENKNVGGVEDLPELIGQAVDHLKKVENNGNLLHVCSYLAAIYVIAGKYKEADHYFQKEFSKELTPVGKQLLHLRYGNFLWYQMKCKEKAIHHYLEGAKIKQESKEREKIKTKLQKIVQWQLSQNEADSEALQLSALLQGLNEDRQ